MSEVIALFSKDKVEFYNKNGESIECENLEKCTIYAILPDKYFFFFQSNITTKRKASRTIEAYAKSIFPVDEKFVWYMNDFLPLIGYVCFLEKIPEQFIEILEKAKIITTPFTLYMYKNAGKDFIYQGDSICALYNESKLEYYTQEDKCSVSDRNDASKGLERIIYLQQDVLDFFWQIIDLKSAYKVNLPISKSGYAGLEGWKIYRFVILAVAIIMFIAGGFMRYHFYRKELNNINKNIEVLYKKALGNKHYNDPYGILLYKAQTSSSGKYLISPFKLIYALSEAKSSNDLKIDYISFGKNNIKIIGKINNYATLVKYVDMLNNLLSKKFVIQNTSSKNGKLMFTLIYRTVS